MHHKGIMRLRNLTNIEASALLEAHDIWALLDNDEEVSELKEHNPDLYKAYELLSLIAESYELPT